MSFVCDEILTGQNVHICGSGGLGPREHSLCGVSSTPLPLLPASPRAIILVSGLLGQPAGPGSGFSLPRGSAHPTGLGENQDLISSDTTHPRPLDQLPQLGVSVPLGAHLHTHPGPGAESLP